MCSVKLYRSSRHDRVFLQFYIRYVTAKKHDVVHDHRVTVYCCPWSCFMSCFRYSLSKKKKKVFCIIYSTLGLYVLTHCVCAYIDNKALLKLES